MRNVTGKIHLERSLLPGRKFELVFCRAARRAGRQIGRFILKEHIQRQIIVGIVVVHRKAELGVGPQIPLPVKGKPAFHLRGGHINPVPAYIQNGFLQWL